MLITFTSNHPKFPKSLKFRRIGVPGCQMISEKLPILNGGTGWSPALPGVHLATFSNFTFSNGLGSVVHDTSPTPLRHCLRSWLHIITGCGFWKNSKYEYEIPAKHQNISKYQIHSQYSLSIKLSQDFANSHEFSENFQNLVRRISMDSCTSNFSSFHLTGAEGEGTFLFWYFTKLKYEYEYFNLKICTQTINRTRLRIRKYYVDSLECYKLGEYMWLSIDTK